MYLAIIEETKGYFIGEWTVNTYHSRESFLNDWGGAKLKVAKDSDNDNLSIPGALDITKAHNEELRRQRERGSLGLTAALS